METNKMTELRSPRVAVSALMRDDVWQQAPHLPTLGVKEVHVWRTPLETAESRLTLLEGILAADERVRAVKYRFEKERNHFIVGRGLLRTILGRYLGTDPSKLRFSYAENGKPSLVMKPHTKMIRFNVSHCHQFALFAVTRDREVGVDIEQMRTDFAVAPVAEQFFSMRERAMLKSLPADLQHEGFFACWTRKEAYVKAVGAGLSLPLDQFDVSLTPGQPAELLATPGDDTKEAQRWSLRELPVGPGYKAALAVEGHDVELRCWMAD